MIDLTQLEKLLLVDCINLGIKGAAHKNGITNSTMRNHLTTIYLKLDIGGTESKLILAMTAALRRGDIQLEQLERQRVNRGEY